MLTSPAGNFADIRMFVLLGRAFWCADDIVWTGCHDFKATLGILPRPDHKSTTVGLDRPCHYKMQRPPKATPAQNEKDIERAVDHAFPSLRPPNRPSSESCRFLYFNDWVIITQISRTLRYRGSILIEADDDVFWVRGRLKPILLDRSNIRSKCYACHDILM